MDQKPIFSGPMKLLALFFIWLCYCVNWYYVSNARSSSHAHSAINNGDQHQLKLNLHICVCVHFPPPFFWGGGEESTAGFEL